MTFGLTIFNALDYKIASDEELSISSPLESLLEQLTLEIEEMEEYDASPLNSDNINLDAIYEVRFVCLRNELLEKTANSSLKPSNANLWLDSKFTGPAK